MQPRERLTSKEVQVATMVWEGCTNRDIASSIGTTEQVIKNYLRSTFDKLGLWSRLELALYVASHGGEKWNELGFLQQHIIKASPDLTASDIAADIAKDIAEQRAKSPLGRVG